MTPPRRQNHLLRLASLALLALAGVLAHAPTASAQTPPNKTEIRSYKGLLSAAIRRDVDETRRLLGTGTDPNVTDANGRTPLIVAAHWGQIELARALVAGGANPNAKDNQRYDIVTIAAVNDDVRFLKAALELGADARAITSPYNGTALIAAAHLGHHRVVAELIAAGAPLDHVNNLGMTAVIEAIVLGDGGANHQATLKRLLDAGANPNLPDRTGKTPRALALSRGYATMADMIAQAGGK
jgi:ankyrin repeat protein